MTSPALEQGILPVETGPVSTQDPLIALEAFAGFGRWWSTAKGEPMPQQVKAIALLKAREGMTREEFERRWLDSHAPLTLRFPRLKGYRINIALREYQDIDGELPYDGTAELWWDSLEEMQADYASSEAAAAVSDVHEFTSVLTQIYTREHVMK